MRGFMALILTLLFFLRVSLLWVIESCQTIDQGPDHPLDESDAADHCRKAQINHLF